MKYVVVEKGYEYNDEYYPFNEDGSYKIVSKLYNTKQEAETNGIRENILDQFRQEDWRTGKRKQFDSSSFDFEMFGPDMGYTDRLKDYFRKKDYPFEEDAYEMNLPKGLSEEEVIEAWTHYDANLFEIVEIEE